MTHDRMGHADQMSVMLFRRNDDAYAADAAQRDSRPTQIKRPVSRLNEACAEMRKTMSELDGIESKLATLREHQLAALAKAAMAANTAKPTTRGRVETVDLRTLVDVDVDVDLTTAQLDDAATSDDADDDFDKRFAAFAAGENDDTSRRWLDTD